MQAWKHFFRQALSAFGIEVRTTEAQGGSHPSITAGAGAAAGIENNGGLWLRTNGVPEFRIGGAWKAIAVKDQTFDSGSAGLKADVLQGSTGTTGNFSLVMGDNLAEAFKIREGSNVFLTFVTTDGGEAVNCFQRLTTTDGVASGTARVVGGRAYSNTAAGSSHTNSTSEVVLGSYSVPANTLKAGSTMRVRWKAKVTANASTTTLTVRLRIGPTTLTGTVMVATAAVDTSANDIATGWVELISRAAPGASVAVEGVGYYSDPAAAGGTMKVASLDATNLATNGALLVEVTGQWSAADANAVQLEHLSVEIQ